MTAPSTLTSKGLSWPWGTSTGSLVQSTWPARARELTDGPRGLRSRSHVHDGPRREGPAEGALYGTVDPRTLAREPRSRGVSEVQKARHRTLSANFSARWALSWPTGPLNQDPQCVTCTLTMVFGLRGDQR